MGLREHALQANKEQQEAYRAQRAVASEASLDEMIARWNERWHLKLEETPTIPAREEFTYKRITYGNGTGRHPTVDGWAFTIDELEFIYSKENGMCVVLICPDCGEHHADSWYGMADLGKRLKAQRSYLHECHKVAARNLAHAIREATNATKLPAHVIFDEALEVMSGWGR